MRVGIDSFTIRELELDPFQQLDYVAEKGFEGLQFGGLGDDVGRLREIKAYGDGLGLYSQTSVMTPNPCLAQMERDDLRAAIQKQVENAAAAGWHELHTQMGGETNRYGGAVPWRQQLADATWITAELGPVLREHGSRINFETHGEVTTWELVRLVEEVGPDIAGICLDTANVLLFAEDPVAAARRAAPYTHLTHCKDAIVYFCERGVRRQGRAPGGGILDWEQILPILGEYEPDLPLSIEDHKWFFEAHIFEQEWLDEQDDLTRDELAQFVRLAWVCQERINRGELPPPNEYEEIPYLDEIDERLGAGRDYLHELLGRLGLRSQA